MGYGRMEKVAFSIQWLQYLWNGKDKIKVTIGGPFPLRSFD